jgi:hypothetical protein
MNLSDWSKDNVDYARKLVDSALEGARSAEETFFHGKSAEPFVTESVRHAWGPALVGGCVGALCASSAESRKSSARTLEYALVGVALGLAVGFAWESRQLARSIARAAAKNVNRVRDEHWFAKNPIDYA